MTPSLRERQHEQTRDLILDTLIDQLAETGAFDYSALELARRAGVSVRTIYRYFPDREALMVAMGKRGNDRMGVTQMTEELPLLPDLVRQLFRTFDANENFILAQLTTQMGGQVRAHGRRDRVAKVRRAVDAAVPELPDVQRTRTVAALTCLLSSTAWLRLKEELDLDGEQAGDAIAWAMQVLIDRTLDDHRKLKKQKERG